MNLRRKFHLTTFSVILQTIDAQNERVNKQYYGIILQILKSYLNIFGDRSMRPQEYGLDMRRSRGAGERQSRMVSTCGPMQPSGCGM